MKCDKCRTTVVDGQEKCPECGNVIHWPGENLNTNYTKTDERKKNEKIVMIGVVVVIFVLIVAAIVLVLI